jgi:hypothetical protein
MVTEVPMNIKGLRLPQRVRILSLHIPKYGWTKTPAMGPKSHIKATTGFAMPSDRRCSYRHNSRLPAE